VSFSSEMMNSTMSCATQI